MNQNVVRSVFTVLFFWWFALAVWGLGWGSFEWSFVLRSTLALVLLVIIGFGVGVLIVWVIIWSEKQTKKVLLEGDSIRGLKCTIGEIPLISQEPKKSENLPDFSIVPDVPANFFPGWFAKYEQSHPAHVELMRALLRIYEYHKQLPATHVPGGHGGRSLLDHSLLAAYFMDKLANTWRYTGLRDRSGKRLVLKLRDPNYIFDPHDPLAAIIGIAHDIGKIEAYIFDKKNPKEIVGIHHEHDLTGARMVARLPEAWAIPDIDRQAMFLAIAHYHHPMELPLSPDRRAIDDRTIALMELLIKADFVTSRVEAKGVEPSQQEYEEDAPSVVNESTTREDLWNAFSEIITEHGRINSADPRFNLATLCAGQNFDKPMLLVKEDSIRSALVKRMQLQSANLLGDGRYQLTIDLLKIFDEKGILLKSHEGSDYSCENALWNVDFMTRAAVGAKPEKKSGWSAVIVLDPKLWPKVDAMEPYWWFAIIQRGTMGAARAINKKKKEGRKFTNLLDATESDLESHLSQVKTEFSSVLEVADTSVDATGEEAVSESQSQVQMLTQEVVTPSLFPALHIADDADDNHKPSKFELTPIWEDGRNEVDDSPEVIPAQQAQNQDIGNMPSKDATPMETSTGTPKKSIAPIDVMEALSRVVQAAKNNGVRLRELNGKYLLSSSTLAMLVPEIDWRDCRYKIEQMCKAKKIEALFIKIGDDGDYALAFKKELS